MINFLMGAGVGVLLMIAAASIAACQLSSQCSREEKRRKTAAVADAQKQPVKSDTLQCGKWHLERLAGQGYMGAQDLLGYIDGLERDNQALESICTGLSKTITYWREQALETRDAQREVDACHAIMDQVRDIYQEIMKIQFQPGVADAARCMAQEITSLRLRLAKVEQPVACGINKCDYEAREKKP
jgi:hypothetical protein